MTAEYMTWLLDVDSSTRKASCEFGSEHCYISESSNFMSTVRQQKSIDLRLNSKAKKEGALLLFSFPYGFYFMVTGCIIEHHSDISSFVCCNRTIIELTRLFEHFAPTSSCLSVYPNVIFPIDDLTIQLLNNLLHKAETIQLSTLQIPAILPSPFPWFSPSRFPRESLLQ